MNTTDQLRLGDFPKYDHVQFGEKNLSNDEAKEIENWLEKLENGQPN